ncbi:hypothetical protein KAU55_00465 [Candidatus Bathyarchaeota archaeon]|nr:hypothetical protein [Candidatus Bathyarchaeota archaeon]
MPISTWRDYFNGKNEFKKNNRKQAAHLLRVARERAKLCMEDLALILNNLDKITTTQNETKRQLAHILQEGNYDLLETLSRCWHQANLYRKDKKRRELQEKRDSSTSRREKWVKIDGKWIQEY